MHAINMDVLPTERCKQQLTYTNFGENIVDGAICAVTKAEKNNVCETDVGGPLACQNEDGRYELAGIYSQDTGCRATNQVKLRLIYCLRITRYYFNVGYFGSVKMYTPNVIFTKAVTIKLLKSSHFLQR